MWDSYQNRAIDVRNYQPLRVPEPVQIPEYARELLRNNGLPLDEAEIEDRMEVWSRRQAMLYGPNRPRMLLVMHEAALRQDVGGTGVMHAQLGHLARCSGLPKVDVRVVPLGAGAYPAMDEAFVLLDFPDGGSVVRIEHRMSSIELEKPDELDGYRVAFNGVLAVAHGPDRSRQMIEGVATELGRRTPR